ncbi:DUF1499 domain-containing protein [Aureimonas sp. AU12]|uniref:DUF1499 domain-containing protein n=1 Tax=Aureimonas sp. AU12 TaxID=1638161 RepID=UPI00078403E9|nr:DUF1499 domain-containing protein [Aureimonas sp. AU12]
MAGHYLRTRARSAGIAWSLGAFALVLIPVSIAFFRLHLLDQETLSWSLALAALLALTGLLLAIYAIARVWHRGAYGGGRAVAAFAVGCLAVLPFVGIAALFAEYPDGNAAETTGLTTAAATVSDMPAAMPDAAAKDVLVGQDFRATASVVYGAARTAIEASGMEIVDVATSAMPRADDADLGVSGTVLVPLPTPRDSVDPAEPYDRFAVPDADEYTIQAIAYSPILALPSDVTIRIAEDGDTTFVDMRSASRTLERDLGQNRRIVQGFFTRLEAAMNVLEGVTPES